MKSTVLSAIMVLLTGVGAGIIANATWYEMPWVRPTLESRSGSNPATRPAGSDSGATTQPDAPVAGSSVHPADPCAPAEGQKPGTVGMACVLHYLEKGGALFIDAREAHDYEEGHLRGAIHLPSSAIYANIGKLDASGVQVTDTLIVYCGGGDCEASHNVAEALQIDFQYQTVLIYEKGWQEIESSGQFGSYIEAGGGA